MNPKDLAFSSRGKIFFLPLGFVVYRFTDPINFKISFVN